MREPESPTTGLSSLLPALASAGLLTPKQERLKQDASDLANANKAADKAAEDDANSLVVHDGQQSDADIPDAVEARRWTLPSAPSTETLVLVVLSAGMMIYAMNALRKMRKDARDEKMNEADRASYWFRVKLLIAGWIACSCAALAGLYKVHKVFLKKYEAEKNPFEVEKPNVKWEDIGGYDKVKKTLQQMLAFPERYAKLYESLKRTPCKGILLYGPPGCCKTMMAKAVATCGGRNFIAIKGPQVFSPYIGVAEENIRNLFKVAREKAPSVIFFDEFEVLAEDRDKAHYSGDGGVSSRILTQILTEMDGMEKAADVIVMAATNRPETLDKAVTRPGRLTKKVYIDLPDIAARKQIFENYLNKCQKIKAEDFVQLAKLSDGYTGAEIAGVYDVVVNQILEELDDAGTIVDEFPFEKVTYVQVKNALKNTKKETTKAVLKKYEEYTKLHGSTN